MDATAEINSTTAATKVKGNITGKRLAVKAMFAECRAGTHMMRCSNVRRDGSAGF